MSRYSSSLRDVPNISLERSDPAAPSDTATLLRLHPNHLSHLRRLAPNGYSTGFGCYKLSWCDGRCVQDPERIHRSMLIYDY